MNSINAYASHSLVSDPAEFSNLFESLPNDVSQLCKIIQGMMLLDGDAHLYSYQIPQERLREVELRLVSNMLARIIELDNSPLYVERKVEDRIIATCRDFSLMLTSMLRHKGIPARVRVGFASHKTYYSEHVITEYWNEDQQRWLLVDAIRNERNIAKHKVTYDVFDVPRDIFITAGLAWNKYRLDNEDPMRFGVGFISGYRGWWYIRNKLIQDLAALNKCEVLPWDHWSVMNDFELGNTPDDIRNMAFFDEIASLTASSTAEITVLAALFEHPLVKPPMVFGDSALSIHNIGRIVNRWDVEKIS